MTIHPGMMFHLAKDRMEKTDLFRIVRKMPKGCLLHAHLDAMVDFDFLLGVIMKEPGMHIRAPSGPLVGAEALACSAIEFIYLKEEQGNGAEIWSSDYVDGSPIRLTKAADAFPHGGREDFLRWLKSRCTLSTMDAVEQHHGIDAVWAKFVRCFMVTNTLIHYEPVFRQHLRRLMRTLHDDGVYWCELR